MARTNSISLIFPLAVQYRELLAAAVPLVRELKVSTDAFPYSERHLQCVWYDNVWRPAALTTSHGEQVTVEDPGRWNLEAGPDFIDALLRVGPGQRRLRGDVEIHVRPADWHRHDHRADLRYSRVIAHITYFPGAMAPGELPAGALQIALRDGLKGMPSFSFDSIDITAYPYANLAAETAPCAEMLRKWPADDCTQLLIAAGHERLRVKAERLAADIREYGSEQVLYEGVLVALGYKHNRIPFRELSRRLPVEALHSAAEGEAERAYALLLGIGSLLPQKVSPRWDTETRDFVRRLWDYWWKASSRWEHLVMSKSAWRLAGLRPQNHPVRRLAAAAALFSREQRLSAELAAVETDTPAAWSGKASSSLAACAHMPYWRRRLTFGGRIQKHEVRLIGTRRLASILSNVVLPFLAASGTDVSSLLADLPAEEDNSLIRQTAHVLFGRDHNPALYRRGIRQQGLLQIFHDFCLNRRNACEDCRLLSAMREHLTTSCEPEPPPRPAQP